jgi:putative drug exporter of the RND superfamily
VVGWAALAIVVSVIAHSAGSDYANNFTLPGTESQHAQDLLQSEFPGQSGDSDTIVFHTIAGSVDSPAVERANRPLLAKVAAMPDVVSVISPHSAVGAAQVSADRRTAFATITYTKRANALPDDAGAPVLAAVQAVHLPGLQVTAGGEVIENAEGFSIGPATDVGVIAALVILRSPSDPSWPPDSPWSPRESGSSPGSGWPAWPPTSAACPASRRTWPS